jgi:regulator of replication initiation timing
MNAETTLDRVMIALGIKSKESESININLETMKTLDGQATFDAETFEVGSPIFVVTQDGNIPAPQGEFAMEDGTIVSVDDKGYIAEISSAEEEAPEEEVVVEEAPMEEMPMEETMAKPKKLTESTIKTTEFSAEVSNLKKEFEALKLKLSSLADENNELKGRLASEEAPRTYHSPEKSNANSLQYKLGEKRAETTQDRVFKQLFK